MVTLVRPAPRQCRPPRRAHRARPLGSSTCSCGSCRSPTWYQVVSRVRDIAEHALASEDDDPLRNTRTVLAGFLARTFVAPYWVNYHLEHHLLVFVPCWKLREAHALLVAKGYRPRMEVAAELCGGHPAGDVFAGRATKRKSQWDAPCMMVWVRVSAMSGLKPSTREKSRLHDSSAPTSAMPRLRYISA